MRTLFSLLLLYFLLCCADSNTAIVMIDLYFARKKSTENTVLYPVEEIMSDQIIQTKTCPISGQEFSITQGDLEFYAKVMPPLAKGVGGLNHIPTPTLCPSERQRRRLSFRNERNLYRRKCDASGKDIISIYKPTPPGERGLGGFIVYDQKIRRSDSRDALDYGQEFDFSKSFMENFRELMQKVPLPALLNLNSENSEYCNRANHNKDCYLAFMISYSQECCYGTHLQKSSQCFDCLVSVDSQHCYQCIDITYCYNLYYSQNCLECHDSLYLQYCQGCSFCYACNNLKNQHYCIFNQQLTKEEYHQKIRRITKEDIQEFQKQVIQEGTILQSESCTGGHLSNCLNCDYCFNGFGGQDCKYIINFADLKDTYDCSAFGYKCSQCIECIAGEENNKTGYCFGVFNAYSVFYSMFCYQNCSNLFGSIGLRNKSYCIFNKQYTKEDYESLAKKIIGHMIETGEWGEFFHPSLSPFGYNETVAQEYYPISRDMLVACPIDGRITNAPLQQRGYHRSDYQSPQPLADKIIEGKDIAKFESYLHQHSDFSSLIKEVATKEPEDLLKTAIKCEITGKLFRIIPQELAFYRKHNLPLPRRHPDQRHLDRLALRR